MEEDSFPSGGFILAGVPVGAAPCRTADVSNDYEEEQVAGIVQRRERTADRLIEMADPHAKYLITRCCVSARYNHLVRGVDPVSVLRGAELHDEMHDRSASSVLSWHFVVATEMGRSVHRENLRKMRSRRAQPGVFAFARGERHERGTRVLKTGTRVR